MSEESTKVDEFIAMEKKHASSLSESVEGIGNVVVREILRGIAHDSRKHAGFYTAILSLITEVEPAIEEKEYEFLQEIIEKHIKVEQTMIEESKQLLDSLDDVRIHHLLKEIYDDEVKHHTLMQRILEAVIRREAIFEADWWDAIWKDVPGHGAPF